jgi:4-amino-4-deoxy-L-arabinose transferase-like glycosyltransferase
MGSGRKRGASRVARVTARRAGLAVVALATLIGLWNTLSYPAGAGFDAASHREYADFLAHHWRLPHENETPEYYSPPFYYAIAGLIVRLGAAAGLAEPHKLGQLLNVPIVAGIGLLTLALAGVLWPGRRSLAAAAASFLVACPLLLKTGSMFNPEPLDALLSVLALYLAARILTGARYGARAALGLGAVLGLGELTRQFALWTLAVVTLAFAAAWLRARDVRILRSLWLALVAVVVLAGPWYGYRASTYGNAVFDRPLTVDKPFFERRPASFYLGTGLPSTITAPYRPHFVNRAWPQTYADLWGDWYGVFAWNRAAAPAPPRAAHSWLTAQMLLGLVPTALALLGWLVLLVRSLRRLDGAFLLPALLPLAGIAGYLYFTVGWPTRDGDVLKPTYMLTTMPAFALCFGFAVDRLGRARLLLVPLLVLLLPFAVYKGAVGWF